MPINHESSTSLFELQTRADKLAAIIKKRQDIVKNPPQVNIERDDSDVQAAAKRHAEVILKSIIPASITRLIATHTTLIEEAETRKTYIKDHSDELTQLAQEFMFAFEKEQEVVRRLERDLRRGFTTQEVVDRRHETLRAMEQTANSDWKIQEGLVLLKQFQERNIELQSTVTDTILEPNEDHFDEDSNYIDTDEKTELKTTEDEFFEELETAEPVLHQLREFGAQLERPVSQEIRDFLDASNTISKNLDAIAKKPTEKLNDREKMLLADIKFLDRFEDLNAYKRNLTPEELHQIVSRVRKLIRKVRRLPETRSKKPSDTFLKGRVSPFSTQLHTTLVDFLSAEYQAENANIQIDGMSLMNLKNLAEAVIPAISRDVRISRYRISVKEQEGNTENALRVVYRAVFSIVAHEMYHAKNLSARDLSLQALMRNDAVITPWYEESLPILEQLGEIPEMEKYLQDFYTAYRAATGLNQFESVKVTTINDIFEKIHWQHVLAKKTEILNRAVFYVHDQKKKEERLSQISIDKIPDLFPQLEHIASSNIHLYNPEITAEAVLRESEESTDDEQTEVIQQLKADLTFLEKYCSDLNLSVYTPAEIHQLAERFRTYSLKIRSDFDEIEAELLSLLSRSDFDQREDHIRLLEGARERFEKETANRKGMTWETMETFCAYGIDKIKNGLPQSLEVSAYFFTAKDPESFRIKNLSVIYQFIANVFVKDVIGERSASNVNDVRKEAFVKNCEIINAWYEENKETIELLPQALKIKGLIDTMNRRLTSNDRGGEYRSYQYGPVGAIKLQYVLAHIIRELRQRVEPLPSDEIVPLD